MLMPDRWNEHPADCRGPAGASDFTAAVGATITWTNTGAVAHTVTADEAASFDSGNLDRQATFSFTPDTPGTFASHCTFHPWMTGSFTVTP
jgi:plastocyanin